MHEWRRAEKRRVGQDLPNCLNGLLLQAYCLFREILLNYCSANPDGYGEMPGCGMKSVLDLLVKQSENAFCSGAEIEFVFDAVAAKLYFNRSIGYGAFADRDPDGAAKQLSV